MFALVLDSDSKWVKVFKNGPSKICGRQSLENIKEYILLRHDMFCLGRPYHFKF